MLPLASLPLGLASLNQDGAVAADCSVVAESVRKAFAEDWDRPDMKGDKRDIRPF